MLSGAQATIFNTACFLGISHQLMFLQKETVFWKPGLVPSSVENKERLGHVKTTVLSLRMNCDEGVLKEGRGSKNKRNTPPLWNWPVQMICFDWEAYSFHYIVYKKLYLKLLKIKEKNIFTFIRKSL
jgi:hypothetical protein